MLAMQGFGPALSFPVTYMWLKSRVMALCAPYVQRVIPLRPYRDRDVIQPKETEAVAPAQILPKGWERLRRQRPSDELENVWHDLNAKRVTHSEVIRYYHGTSIVGEGGYLTWSQSQTNNAGFRKSILVDRMTAVDDAVLLNSNVVNQYFGHWLRDGCASALLDPEKEQIFWHDPAWVHAEEYRNLFELSGYRTGLHIARTLVTYQDYAQGSHKRQRYRVLRARMAKHLTSLSNPKKRVFLNRGRMGNLRFLKDEGTVLARLDQDGWDIVQVGDLTAKEIQNRCHGAEVVSSVEGSQINHAYYSASDGAKVVILLPQDRLSTIHLGNCRAFGFTPSFCVMTGDATSGYVFDYDEFRRTAEMIGAD